MSKVKALSQEEQLALRNRVKEELERVESLLSDEKTNEMINRFKDKFAICEISYKVALDVHQYNKHGKHYEHLKVDMRQVPHALNYAGYSFEHNLLNKLFGGENTPGNRSVKKLRDALTHSLNKKAVDELTNREGELHELMDEFLNILKNYDAV